MKTHKDRKYRDQARLGSAERWPVSREAIEAFRRPAYQTISVIEYLARKYGIGGETIGQKHTGPICGYDRGNQRYSEEKGEIGTGH